MKNKKMTFQAVSVGMLWILLLSCGGGSSNGGGSAETVVAFGGTVIAFDGTPIAEADVTVEGETAQTDSSGAFSFDIAYAQVPNRITYEISKEGYFDFVGGVRPSPNGEATVTVALNQRTLMGTVNGSTGGTVSSSSMSIEVGSNAFVDDSGNTVSGDVNVFANDISPDDENFSAAMPGGDFQATDTNGADGSLTSFGALNLELEDAGGNNVDLQDSVQITLAIPASLRSDAPDTIDVWILIATGRWEVGGTATRVGDNYVFTIQSEGAINCDLFGRNAIVEGTVYDFGTPVPNIPVEIGQLTTSTDSLGEYSALVPSNVDLTFDAGTYGSVDKQAGELSTTSVNIVDIGSSSVPTLGEGSYTFLGTAYSGFAVFSLGVWGITDASGSAVLSISGVPDSGSRTVAEGVFVGLSFQFGSVLYYAASGSVTRSGNNLSFSFVMADATNNAEVGTLSGQMAATDVGAF